MSRGAGARPEEAGPRLQLLICKPPDLWGPHTQLRGDWPWQAGSLGRQHPRNPQWVGVHWSFRQLRTTTRLALSLAGDRNPGEILLGGDLLLLMLLLLLLLVSPLMLFIVQIQH